MPALKYSEEGGGTGPNGCDIQSCPDLPNRGTQDDNMEL